MGKAEETVTTKYILVEEASDTDNFCRSIYENDYKGLLIARCDQQFSYTHGQKLVEVLNAGI